MKNTTIWALDNFFQHPFKPSNVSPEDVVYNLLERKLCPIHLSPLILCEQIELHDGEYIRKRYGCLECHCEADFVGYELKSDSVCRTIEFINNTVVLKKVPDDDSLRRTGGIEL